MGDTISLGKEVSFETDRERLDQSVHNEFLVHDEMFSRKMSMACRRTFPLYFCL